MYLSLLYATATVALASALGSWLAPAAAAADVAPRAVEIVSAGPMTARVDVAMRYAPLVRRIAAAHLDGSESPDRAWSVAREQLLTLRDGRAFVVALERGDLQSAVRLMPVLQWPDGRVVTL